MRRLDALVVALVVALVLASPCVLAAPPKLPRYQLPPGRMLIYSYSTHSTTDGKEAAPGKGRFALTVLRENADGSRRVVFTTLEDYEASDHSDSSVRYADVFADGHILHNDTLDEGTTSLGMFPILPDTKQLAEGWSQSRPERLEETTCTARWQGDQLILSQDTAGTIKKLYGSARQV